MSTRSITPAELLALVPLEVVDQWHRRRSTQVYRAYDDEGQLLYVGMTEKPAPRMTMHRTKTPWWAEVTTCTWEEHYSRWHAATAEIIAIRTQGPRYNIQHTRPHSRVPGHRWVERQIEEFMACPEPELAVRAAMRKPNYGLYVIQTLAILTLDGSLGFPLGVLAPEA